MKSGENVGVLSLVLLVQNIRQLGRLHLSAARSGSFVGVKELLPRLLCLLYLRRHYRNPRRYSMKAQDGLPRLFSRLYLF